MLFIDTNLLLFHRNDIIQYEHLMPDESFHKTIVFMLTITTNHLKKIAGYQEGEASIVSYGPTTSIKVRRIYRRILCTS